MHRAESDNINCQAKGKKVGQKQVYCEKTKENMKLQKRKYDTDNDLKAERAVHNKKYYQKKKKLLHAPYQPGAIKIDVFDENTVTANTVGQMDYICGKCGALMFKDELYKPIAKDPNHICFSLCCSYGNLKVPPVSKPLHLLMSLLSGNSPESRHFVKNIRAYNSAFAFASMTLTGQEYEFQGKGPYCFRINGQIFHKISQLFPQPGNTHTFSQIYLYDSETEINTRLQLFTALQEKTMRSLQCMINSVNPYAGLYHGVRDLMNRDPTTDVRLVLRPSGEGIDHRRYNIPTGSDIAMVIPVDDADQPLNKNIVIYKTKEHHPSKNNFMLIDDRNPMYDPLLYVLMFPYGDKGWELQCTCTQLQYYAYCLMVHSGATFNIIHRMGRLFQQYIVDMYSKVEAARLSYIRFNQTKLHSEMYQGLSDALQGSDGDVDGSQLGRKVILPSSFTGSAHYQHQLYQDAMAIVRRYGKPDLFITFTCNPQWPEISGCLFPNQTSSDRPDIAARVFKLKLKSFLHDIYYSQKPIFGKMSAIIYVIEWQK